MNLKSAICPLSLLFVFSCEPGGPGAAGQQGAEGQQGMQGQQGTEGPQGPPGPAGMNGRDALGASDASGTRIKRYASVLTSTDGLKVTTPGYLYRDTSLGMDCVFQAATDGTQRCMPYWANGDAILASSSTSYFLDAGCTQKLHFASKPCMAPKYLLLQSTSTATCPATTQYAVYASPSAVTPSAMYSGAPGACSSVPKASIDSLLMSIAFYDLNAKTPVSPSTFAVGTTTQMLMP